MAGTSEVRNTGWSQVVDAPPLGRGLSCSPTWADAGWRDGGVFERDILLLGEGQMIKLPCPLEVVPYVWIAFNGYIAYI